MPGVMRDREVWVQPHQRIRTGWVHVDDCVLGCRARMDFAAIERAAQRILQMGGCQSWPCPVGHWRGDRFVVDDGRHEFMAVMGLGHEGLFVAWVEEAEEAKPA